MATTIYTYLHDDDLKGSRYVYIDDCMCKLYSIQRTDSKFLNEFKDELKMPALYILLNRGCRKAYIGETDDFLKRINQHLSGKNFWTEVLVFMGTDDTTLGKTEVQYLEFLALEKAKSVKSYDLTENTQAAKQPHMGVVPRKKTEKFFEYVESLSGFVGCDIFESSYISKLQESEEIKAPVIIPEQIRYSREELSGRIKMSLNGKGPFTKRQMVLNIVKEYLLRYPTTTFSELKLLFKREYLGQFAKYEFLTSNIEKAKSWRELNEDHVHYFIDESDILISGDGIRFCVCVEWDRTNIVPVLGIAAALGWVCEIVK